MKNWKDHVPEAERQGLLSEADDGSAILLSSYAGGAAQGGLWSTLTLMCVDADGIYQFRNYQACGGWHFGLSNEDQTASDTIAIDSQALEFAKNAFVTEGASLTIRNGQVTGRENFDARMRAAITAYLAAAAEGAPA